MRIFNSSLRTKSMMALVLAFILALGPAVFIGFQVLEKARAHFGKAYAENFTLLSTQKIEAPVTRELAISKRFADSVVVENWLEDKNPTVGDKLFFREAEGFREDFRDKNYFVISRKSRAYYLNSPDKPYSREPRYYLDPDNPDDEWFFSTIEKSEPFNINMNHDVHLDETNVWFNVIVENQGKRIGLAGTGLNLGDFLAEFISNREAGVTPMIVDSEGLIQAHPNRDLISFGSGSGTGEEHCLKERLSDPGDADKLENAMQKVRDNPGSVETLWAGLSGREQLLALTWMPELKWHAVSAVDLKAARVVNQTWIFAAVAGMAIIFGILMFVFGYGVNRLVLRPLNRLHQSAKALAGGDYDVSLPPAGKDEIGDLSRAFSAMVDQVKAYTRNLEEKVRERTKELEDQSVLLKKARDEAEEASMEKTEILDKVMESIHYAQTIQQAILTGEEHLRSIIPESFVLWQPKDVISGDMVWSKTYEDGFAIAVMDCTGHGVPGGVMTMAAVSSLDRAAIEINEKPPGEILCEVSRVVQAMLSSQESSGFSEDGLDMGLCVYSRSRGTLYFAGSRISLIYGGGKGLAEISGDRQSLGYCSSDPDFPFQTHAISIDEPTMFYLVTDGIIDQVGEETGLPLGRRRFVSFLNTIMDKGVLEQKQALREMFEAHQGEEEQRDDVTAVGFRLYQ
ncbi:MAG: biofilm regulation protein phosphatase SiaA [Desulfobacterales bacterium]